ncbi:lipase family protein [Mycolicibacterium elephantis]|uniref:lipase family protein n=2 Tax=Mycolicibacterium elephantis TaxID=81858 RepID=UPI003A893B4C
MGLRLVVAAVGVVSVLAGCAPSPPQPPADYNRPPRTLTPPFVGATELPPPDMTDDGPGSLVEVKPLAPNDYFTDAGVTAVRVVYRSTTNAGQPVDVSGVVAVPAGKAPEGGWPIIAFGHSLTGVTENCAPSLARGLGGYASAMTVMLNRGYMVMMPDFQGLGVPGRPHAPLDWVALGNNMIDGVRAARRVLPDASDNWGAYGSGQGGLAAWASAIRAVDYGGGLNLVGAVALSPYADLSPLVDIAATGHLSQNQYRLLMVILQSLSQELPSLDLDAYRSGLAGDHWDELTSCAPADPAEAQRVASQLGPDDLRPRDDAAAAALRDALSSLALPGASPAPAAPVLVVYGTDDPLVPQAGVALAVKEACAKGDPIVVNRRIGDTTTTNEQIIQSSLQWLRARFDGQRPADLCVGAT